MQAGSLNRRHNWRWLLAFALSAFALHVLLFFRFAAGDVIWFVLPWYEHILGHGRIAAFGQPFSNYTPPYLYLLSATTLLDGLVHGYYLIKLLSCAGAVWLVYGAFRLLQSLDREPSAALAVVLLPSVVANVSMLGQADTFWVAPCVLALAAAVRERWSWVAIWSGLAFAFKAQAIFFAPFVIHLFLTRRVSWKLWLVPAAVCAAAMVPAWLAGWPAWDLATIYLRQAAWQPEDGTIFISNGASWWTWFGYLSPELAIRSFWLGFIVTLAAFLVYVKAVSLEGSRRVLLAGLISAAGMPFLLPGMHERFYMLADVLAFIYAFAFPSRRSIVAAIAMQVASALPVYVWAFEAEPLQLIAPAFAIVAIYLVLKELTEPAGSPRIPSSA